MEIYMSKFMGSIDELKTIFKENNIIGNWSFNETSNQYTFKNTTGSIINWWPTKGTLQFQGQHLESFKASILSIINHTNTNTTYNNNSKKIFIVYGHDTNTLDQLELILRRADLSPYILKNESEETKTIIEALEGNIQTNCGCGIVLLTPDDYGYSKDKTDIDKQARARQNVILEMGMILAAFGRQRTLILKKGNLEIPSDINGVLYIDFNDRVDEVKDKIANKLEKLGFNINRAKM